MDTTENQNNENAVPKSKNQYLSVEQYLEKMKLAFSNGKLPEILNQMTPLGYTEEKMNRLLTKVAHLESLHHKQKREYAEQYEETHKLEQKRKEINDTYMRHLSFCKILFKGNMKASTALGFTGKRKTAYADWFHQVSGFYTQLLADATLLAKAESINIKRADLEAMKTELENLTQLKENQKKEVAEAQEATELRDKAFDELYPLYMEFIEYAKVQLQNKQTLEALGIVVKR